MTSSERLMNPSMFVPPMTASRLPPWPWLGEVIPRALQNFWTALATRSSKSGGRSSIVML